MSELIATEFQLHSLTAEDTTDWTLWSVYIRRVHTDEVKDWWVIESQFCRWNVSRGEWARDPRPAHYEPEFDTWVYEHCLPLSSAAKLAPAAARELMVNGKTADDIRSKVR